MWFRRDLRAADNAALHHALARCARVHCVFVFDTDILAPLARDDRRVGFIHASLGDLDRQLGGRLQVLHGRAVEEIPRLARELRVRAVFSNRDYEPQAITRDDAVRTALARDRIELHAFKDQVVFEARELLTQAGQPYSVFTPYKKAWLARLAAEGLPAYDASAPELERIAPCGGSRLTSLDALGFAPLASRVPAGSTGARELLADFLPRLPRYGVARDFPAVKAPSYLSAHLRFGTVSVRELVRIAHARAGEGDAGAATWLSELVWRDFYFQVLANFPHVAERSFRPEFDSVRWEEGPAADAMFAAWCEARTGYPLVDAAMAQLNTTGYMHNRLRMVTASFLTKDLGIDWRRGERWFARQLLDYDLAANNGGWQWAASTGCDAQPWFRIFNPVSQGRKFDPDGRFIRRYLPQLADAPPELLHTPGAGGWNGYPAPVVDHARARERTLARFGAIRRE